LQTINKKLAAGGIHSSKKPNCTITNTCCIINEHLYRNSKMMNDE
jgi:hypothetical protein